MKQRFYFAPHRKFGLVCRAFAAMWAVVLVMGGFLMLDNFVSQAVAHTTDVWESESGFPGTLHYGGDVGIGVEVPDDSLHISDSGTNIRNRLRLEVTGDKSNQDALITFSDPGEGAGTHWSIGADDSGDVFRISNGEELDTNTRILIDTIGNVGIGAIDPDEKFEVDGDARFGTDLRLRQSSSSDYVIEHTTDTGDLFIRSFESGDSSGDIILNDLAGGKVGIGTRYPDTKLDLEGAFSVREMAEPAVSPAGQGRIYFDSSAKKFRVSEDNGNYVDLVGSGGSQNLASAYANSGSVQLTAANGDIKFFNDSSPGVQMLFLDEDTGNVGVGTDAPSSKLDIVGSFEVGDDSTYSRKWTPA